MQMFLKMQKDHITKGLQGALLDSDQKKSELKMAETILSRPVTIAIYLFIILECVKLIKDFNIKHPKATAFKQY